MQPVGMRCTSDLQAPSTSRSDRDERAMHCQWKKFQHAYGYMLKGYMLHIERRCCKLVRPCMSPTALQSVHPMLPARAPSDCNTQTAQNMSPTTQTGSWKDLLCLRGTAYAVETCNAIAPVQDCQPSLEAPQPARCILNTRVLDMEA